VLLTLAAVAGTILMTALATGLALLPLALTGNKPGQEIEYPLALVILGGLITSTVLNLLLLPPLYAAFGQSAKVGINLAE
ncbi:MAG TPA: efflux RND transporter permease subunit, partial [Gemmatales bacterium]|nr:efflux RND transporter permease subunit [Gemmatales bacterium]